MMGSSPPGHCHTGIVHSLVTSTSAGAAGACPRFGKACLQAGQSVPVSSDTAHIYGGNVQPGPGRVRTDCCRTLSRGSVPSSRGWATGCRPGPATLASCSVQAQAWQATAGLLALSPATTAATMGPPWLRITCTVLVVSEAVVTMGVTAACTVCKPAGWPCQQGKSVMVWDLQLSWQLLWHPSHECQGCFWVTCRALGQAWAVSMPRDDARAPAQAAAAGDAEPPLCLLPVQHGLQLIPLNFRGAVCWLCRCGPRTWMAGWNKSMTCSMLTAIAPGWPCTLAALMRLAAHRGLSCTCWLTCTSCRHSCSASSVHAASCSAPAYEATCWRALHAASSEHCFTAACGA